MNGNFPILIVEDSEDDYEITKRAFKKQNLALDLLHRCEDAG